MDPKRVQNDEKLFFREPITIKDKIIDNIGQKTGDIYQSNNTWSKTLRGEEETMKHQSHGYEKKLNQPRMEKALSGRV